jgi:hypothetical protein
MEADAADGWEIVLEVKVGAPASERGWCVRASLRALQREFITASACGAQRRSTAGTAADVWSSRNSDMEKWGIAEVVGIGEEVFPHETDLQFQQNSKMDGPADSHPSGAVLEEENRSLRECVRQLRQQQRDLILAAREATVKARSLEEHVEGQHEERERAGRAHEALRAELSACKWELQQEREKRAALASELHREQMAHAEALDTVAAARRAAGGKDLVMAQQSAAEKVASAQRLAGERLHEAALARAAKTQLEERVRELEREVLGASRRAAYLRESASAPWLGTGGALGSPGGGAFPLGATPPPQQLPVSELRSQLAALSGVAGRRRHLTPSMVSRPWNETAHADAAASTLVWNRGSPAHRSMGASRTPQHLSAATPSGSGPGSVVGNPCVKGARPSLPSAAMSSNDIDRRASRGRGGRGSS